VGGPGRAERWADHRRGAGTRGAGVGAKVVARVPSELVAACAGMARCGCAQARCRSGSGSAGHGALLDKIVRELQGSSSGHG
jgi:hypothetical protein